MARYINLDALCEILDEDIETGDEVVTISWVKSWLLAQTKLIIPDTADVVPKSEVAGEIFEEIDELLVQNATMQIATITLHCKLAELKKKYTESEDKG